MGHKLVFPAIGTRHTHANYGSCKRLVLWMLDVGHGARHATLLSPCSLPTPTAMCAVEAQARSSRLIVASFSGAPKAWSVEKS
eukprot:scaffold168347_cov31-Tisochrysis_lutea.AAC.4